MCCKKCCISMSQSEVFEFLKNKRLSGDDSYFSAKDICKSLNLSRNSVYDDLLKLRIYGFLEISVMFKKKRHTKILYTGYRVKKEFI